MAACWSTRKQWPATRARGRPASTSERRSVLRKTRWSGSSYEQSGKVTMKVNSAMRDAVLAITDSVLLGRWTNTYPELAEQIFCELETAPYTDGVYLLEMCNGDFRANE